MTANDVDAVDCKWMQNCVKSSLEDDDGLKSFVERLTDSLIKENWTAATETDFSCVLRLFCNTAVEELLGCETEQIKTWIENAKEHILFYEDIKLLMLSQIHKTLLEKEENCALDAICLLLRNLVPSLKKGNKYLCRYNKMGRPLAKQLKCKRLNKFYCNIWLERLKYPVGDAELKILLVWLPDELMAKMEDPTLLTDFFVRSYRQGDPFDILALNGIFQLIHKHNLEYPQFYTQVYGLVRPHVCYSEHRERFFKLLDLFLSSTHLPAYLAAAFAKRISRLAMLAPVESMPSLIAFVLNLLVRHPSLSVLVHKNPPITLENDPFLPDEIDPANCLAIESSLWEIKSLQNHWYGPVSERAQFIDKALPKMESFIFERKIDALIDEELDRKVKENQDVAVTFVPPKSLFDWRVFDVEMKVA